MINFVIGKAKLSIISISREREGGIFGCDKGKLEFGEEEVR